MKQLRRSSSGKLHDIAVGFQCLDPAWGILLHVRRGVIKPRVVIRLAAGEHEVNRTNHFMGNGDYGFLVATPNHEAPVFLPKYRQRANCPIRGLAQQIPDHRIAFARLPALALARAFVVAGAQGRPGREAVGVAEMGEVVADLDQDQCRRDFSDAGDRLQHRPGPGVGHHGVAQIGVESFQVAFQLPHVFPDFLQHQAMPGRQVAIQRGQQGFLGRLEASAEFDQFAGCQAVDQAIDHRSGGLPVDVGDQSAEFDAGVVEHLVQPVGLGRQIGFHLAPVAADQAQFAQVFGWNEARPDQAVATQLRQPFGIGDVGLAARARS